MLDESVCKSLKARPCENEYVPRVAKQGLKSHSESGHRSEERRVGKECRL